MKQRIIIGDTYPALTSGIRNAREWSMNYAMEAGAMLAIQSRLQPVIYEVAQIVASTHPTVLPMTWSTYPERLWAPAWGYCRPCVTLNQSNISYTKLDYRCVSGDRMGEIFRDSTTITIKCEPSWETYKRWGWVMIEDFYRALRALRYAYDIDWEDISEVQTQYAWMGLSYRYVSKKPIETLVTRIEETEQYGEMISERKTEIKLWAEFCLPNTPEDQQDNANCHVVEEEVTETVKKKVKRIKCV